MSGNVFAFTKDLNKNRIKLTSNNGFRAGEIVYTETPLLRTQCEISHPDRHNLIMELFSMAPEDTRAAILELPHTELGPSSQAPPALVNECSMAATRAHKSWAGAFDEDTLCKVAVLFAMHAHAQESNISCYGIFKHASYLLQTCDPNISFTFRSDGEGVFIALVDIFEGDTLSIDRLHYMADLPSSKRHDILRARFLQTCECSFYPQIVDRHRAIPCPSCHPRDARDLLPKEAASGFIQVHYMLRSGAPDLGAPWDCIQCGAKFKDSQIGFALGEEAYFEGKIDSFRKNLNSATEATYFELKGLLVFIRQLLGCRHWLMASVLMLLCQWLTNDLKNNPSKGGNAKDFRSFEAKSMRERYSVELREFSEMLWDWFICVGVSPIKFSALYVQIVAELKAQGTPGIEGLLDSCCWLYPMARRLFDPDSSMIKELMTIIGDIPILQVLQGQGDQALHKKRYGDAIGWYNQALIQDPTNQNLLMRRATAFQGVNAWAMAHKDAQLCVELHPHYSPGWLRLAMLREAMGDWEGAHQATQDGLKVDPSNEALQKIFENSKKQALEEANAKATPTTEETTESDLENNTGTTPECITDATNPQGSEETKVGLSTNLPEPTNMAGTTLSDVGQAVAKIDLQADVVSVTGENITTSGVEENVDTTFGEVPEVAVCTATTVSGPVPEMVGTSPPALDTVPEVPGCMQISAAPSDCVKPPDGDMERASDGLEIEVLPEEEGSKSKQTPDSDMEGTDDGLEVELLPEEGERDGKGKGGTVQAWE